MKSAESVAMNRVPHQFDWPEPVNSPRGSVVLRKHSVLFRSVSW